MQRWFRTLTVALATLLLAACGGSASLRYYVIDAEPGAVLREAAPLSLEIIDVEVPQYLERFQLATRVSGNEVDYAATHQWSEPLRKTLARVLAEHLATVLSTPDVSTPHARLASRPELRLQVHVDRFERGVDGRVELRGRWQVTNASDGSVLATEAVRLVEGPAVAADDYAALVATMQARFAQFAQRIAESVAEHAEDVAPGAAG